MKLSIIVAVARNGVIGNQNGLPWHLSTDLKRFKKITLGHHLIMGRKTYASIGRPLPGRTTIVLTRHTNSPIPGVHVVNSLEAACELAAGDDEVFVVGGRQIYEIAIPQAERLYWTDVDASPQGDTYFPKMNWDDWKLIEEETCSADQKNDYKTTFRVFDRVNQTNSPQITEK